MSDPGLIKEIMAAVSIPVMAKVRIGHFVEAQILEALGVDLHRRERSADPGRRRAPHQQARLQECRSSVAAAIWARRCGASGEGAAMIRTKGEAGTGDVVEAVRHARTVLGDIRRLQNMPEEELMTFAKEIGAPLRTGEGDAKNSAACRWSTSLPAASPPRPTPR
jgi:pyridoxal 5'-phosphate synthase pdxS subunit